MKEQLFLGCKVIPVLFVGLRSWGFCCSEVLGVQDKLVVTFFLTMFIWRCQSCRSANDTARVGLCALRRKYERKNRV